MSETNQFDESSLLREKYIPSSGRTRFDSKLNNVPILKEEHRYQVLCDYRSSLAGADSYTINRVNFDFLLNSYNKYLDARAEIQRLKALLKGG